MTSAFALGLMAILRGADCARKSSPAAGQLDSGTSFACLHQSRHELIWDAKASGGFHLRDQPDTIIMELPKNCRSVPFASGGSLLKTSTTRKSFLQMKSATLPEPRLPLIPYPAFLEKAEQKAAFKLAGVHVKRGQGIPQNDTLIQDLVAHLGKVDATFAKKKSKSNRTILLKLDTDLHGEEGYHIHIDTDKVELHAKTLTGLFYAVQTFKQLSNNVTELPALVIKDRPRFHWRGIHLDVSRHFFPAHNIKKLLDVMAMFKFNRLHWHLTDDQGWRLPIDGYARLTEIGSESVDGSRQSYTADEIKDIVAYAKARHIEVMPEIDNPGHAEAAIAAYPELGISDSIGYVQPTKPMKSWGVSAYTLSPNDDSMKFLETVFTQVDKLFPFGFVHIGGDEADQSQWRRSAYSSRVMRENGISDVQTLFTERVADMLHKLNKTMVGWDEVQNRPGLPQDAVVMAWRGLDQLEMAVRNGHRAINAFSGNYYFDWRQGMSNEPQGQPGYLPLHKTYGEDVVPPSLVGHEDQILGAQGQLWSEYISSWDHLEYMAFPRAIALAERVWSLNSNIVSFEEFRHRLESRLGDLDAMLVNYRKLRDDPGLEVARERIAHRRLNIPSVHGLVHILRASQS